VSQDAWCVAQCHDSSDHCFVTIGHVFDQAELKPI